MSYPIVDDHRLARMFATRRDAHACIRRLENRQAIVQPVQPRTYTMVAIGINTVQYMIAIDCDCFRRRMYVGE